MPRSLFEAFKGKAVAEGLTDAEALDVALRGYLERHSKAKVSA